MSIASEISRIAGNVADAFDAIEAKGVTVPALSTSDDLASLIMQITGGGGVGVVYQDENGYIVIDDAEPYERTISITNNGTYNVAGYGTASVSVSGGTPTLQTVTKTYAPTTSQQTDTITPSAGYDGIGEVDVTVSAIPISESTGTTVVTDYSTVGGVPWCDVTVYESHNYDGYKAVTAATQEVASTSFQAVDRGTTITPTESAQTVGGPDYMMRGAVTVAAIPSNYVGSGVTQRTSSDLSASGATVTAPAGYYSSAATKTVASGTEGTPTATKGTVSSNSITVTPSVTNTAGYVGGGTHTGTAVTVSASELVSGTKSITAAGTTDVTNYASASVASGTATPAASISGTSASVSTGTNTLTLSKTVSNTPQVSAGYVSSGTAGNTSVSLTASVTTKAAATITPGTSNQTIASGTYLTGTQTISGDANLVAGNIKSGTSIFGVTGTYTGGGSGGMNKQIYYGYASVKNNGYTASSATITVAVTGTYKVSWVAWRSSSQGTMGTNLHRNTSSGTNQQTFTSTYGQQITLTNQSYTAGDVLTIYATSGSTSRTIYIANFIIEQTA